jgi:hypothetical protein
MDSTVAMSNGFLHVLAAEIGSTQPFAYQIRLRVGDVSFA